MEKKHKQIDSWEKADIGRRVRMLIDVLPDKPMEEEKVKRLIEMADEQDQVKLKVLYNAVIKGVNEYNKNSTQAKLKKLEIGGKGTIVFYRCHLGKIY